MRSVLTLVLVVLFLVNVSCSVDVFEQKRVLMGTVVSISIFDYSEPEHWRAHLDSAFTEIASLEKLTTIYDDSSEISTLNQMAGITSAQLSAQVLDLLRLSKQVGDLSGGSFDVSVAPVLNAWHFYSAKPLLPSDEEIRAALSLVDYRKIDVEDDRASLQQSGMSVDLGGIAKGRAVDLAAQKLLELGYLDFMVEAGGDLRAVASDATKGLRKIWIQHPRAPDRFFASFRLDEGAVATSGDYEKYFETRGKRYHHILDPKTGYPASRAVSVTIIAETAAFADGLSTAVFVLGPRKGLELIERTPDVEGLIIYLEENQEELSWLASRNIQSRIEIINDD